jgi:hypothetical protein
MARSEVPGAVVVGDYAVDADEVSSLNDVTARNSDGSGSLWTTLVLGPVVGNPIGPSVEESRDSHVEPSTVHPHRRRRRRYLWGEILLGLQYDDGGVGGSESRDGGDVYDDNGGDNNTRILRRRLDNDGTFAHIRHPGGNDNRDGNSIQREDIEDTDVEYTDADHSSDDDGDDDDDDGNDGDDDDDDDDGYDDDGDSADGTDMLSRW